MWAPRPSVDDPVIVGINEAFLDSVDEPLALSHLYISRSLKAVSQVEPKVIALDFSLPEKRFETLTSIRQPDLDFHRSLLAGLLQATLKTTVIAAKVWDDEHHRFQDIQVDFAQVLDMQSEKLEEHASALFVRDPDGRIRRYPDQSVQPGGSASFTGEISAAAGRRQEWSGLINYAIGKEFSYIPLQEVLALDAKGDTERLKQLFAGKTVLFGSVLEDLDLLDLPVALAAWMPGNRRVPGVLAHAQVLRTMNSNAFIQPIAKLWQGMLCGLAALLWFGSSLRKKILALAAGSFALLAASAVLLLQQFWLAPSAVLLVGVLAASSRAALEGWRHFREKQWLTRTFSGYVSPGVLTEILAGSIDTESKGKKQHVCVLFSDIRGFTTLSERLDAEEVVSLLNRYFARMTEAVHRHGGTVDKFIGDGMMAFFGAPNALACPERNALNAAQEMLIALEDVNRHLAQQRHAPLAIGIGIHSGEAVIGHIGSPDRHEYTAIGDTVNTAARLEGLCKDLGTSIVCSERAAVAAGRPRELVKLGEQPLKGRSPIMVYGWQLQSTPASACAALEPTSPLHERVGHVAP